MWRLRLTALFLSLHQYFLHSHLPPDLQFGLILLNPHFSVHQSSCSRDQRGHTRDTLGDSGNIHSPPRKVPTKLKHRNTGRARSSADTVTTTHVQRPRMISEPDSFCMILWFFYDSLICFLGKCHWLHFFTCADKNIQFKIVDVKMFKSCWFRASNKTKIRLKQHIYYLIWALIIETCITSKCEH